MKNCHNCFVICGGNNDITTIKFRSGASISDIDKEKIENWVLDLYKDAKPGVLEVMWDLNNPRITYVVFDPDLTVRLSSYKHECYFNDSEKEEDWNGLYKNDLVCKICKELILQQEEWETARSMWRLGGWRSIADLLVQLGFSYRNDRSL